MLQGANAAVAWHPGPLLGRAAFFSFYNFLFIFEIFLAATPKLWHFRRVAFCSQPLQLDSARGFWSEAPAASPAVTHGDRRVPSGHRFAFMYLLFAATSFLISFADVMLSLLVRRSSIVFDFWLFVSARNLEFFPAGRSSIACADQIFIFLRSRARSFAGKALLPFCLAPP